MIAQEGVEYEEETPNKVKKVELEIQSDKEESSIGTNSEVGKEISMLIKAYFFFKKKVFVNKK